MEHLFSASSGPEKFDSSDVHRREELHLNCSRTYFVRFILILINITMIQGSRSCTGARVAPAKKFGLGRKF